ncbi:MAG: RluA family pseudouridine synthase [Myxococcota bacterium]
MAEIIVAKEFDGIKIERFIKRLYPDFPMSFIFKLLRKGKVRVNKKKVSHNFRIKENDSVILHLPPESLIRGEKNRSESVYNLIDSDIIDENEHFIAINKPAGFAVHGGEGHIEDTFLKAVHNFLGYKESSMRFPPTPVHRLDIDTSGVLIIAKKYEFLRKFNELQRERKVYKEYICLVSGEMREKEKVVTSPVIRMDRPENHSVGEIGRSIFKLITISSRFASENRIFSLLRVELKTGRTHQIRSHLMQIGYPIAGDRLYGDTETNKWIRERAGLRRQFLHSNCIDFEYNGLRFHLVAQLPEELRRTLEILEIDFSI